MIARCPHDWSSPQLDLACLDDAEVVLRCERNPSVLVRFAQRHAATDPLDRRMFFAVDARAPGLHARLTGVTNFVTGRGLARFVEALDFRGWQGELRWANADLDLEVGARFESGGHVALAWTLRPWRSATGGWETTVVTWLEAGAAKDDLAARLDDFLAAQGFPVDHAHSP